MELPPGPRTPAVWQAMAWMARPGAFLARVYERFGDPATISTYWTKEPMVLFSGPDAVRAVFGLDPAIPPVRAGSSRARSPGRIRSCCSPETNTCASGACSRGRFTGSGCATSRR